MEIYKKLSGIQCELVATKGQYNNFGKYSYRSCEDILEAVKPLLDKYKVAIVIKDDIVLVGDRFYVKATATLIDSDTGETVEASAFARESADKKGMDASQVTGATSSYARKYALNGLFAIDDNKNIFIAYMKRNKNNEWVWCSDDNVDLSHIITHWMPIPKLPKE